jgi:hypothetical protein
MVEKPSDYRWSSHRFYLGEETNALLTPSPTFLGLSNDPELRRASYKKLTKLWIDKPVDKIQAKKFFRNRSSALHPSLSAKYPYLPIRHKFSLTKNMSDNK